MIVVVVIIFALMIAALYGGIDGNPPMETMNFAPNVIAKQLIIYHGAAVRNCVRTNCGTVLINPTADLPDTMQGVGPYAFGTASQKFFSVSDGAKVLTFYYDPAMYATYYDQFKANVISGLLSTLDYDTRPYAGYYSVATQTLVSPPSIAGEYITLTDPTTAPATDTILTTVMVPEAFPSSIAGTSIPDGAPAIVSRMTE